MDQQNNILFLLSTEEAENLPEQLLKFYKWWWLRSPGYSRNYAVNVSSDGSIYYCGLFINYVNYAVRPAFNYKSFISESDNLKEGDKIEITMEDGKIYTATVIDTKNGIALFNEETCEMVFNKDRRKGNDYKTSDIAKHLNKLSKQIEKVTIIEKHIDISEN